jgi:hypothetical protein
MASTMRSFPLFMSLVFLIVVVRLPPQDWVARVAKRANHSSAFEELNASLSQAMSDLHFGLDIGAIFDARRDAQDAARDLQDIKTRQEEILDTLYRVDARAQHNDAQAREFQAARFQSQKKMMNNLERNFAKLLEIQAKQAASPTTPNSSVASPSSRSMQPNKEDFLHIDLTDLRLDPKPIGSGGFGDVFR